MTKVSTRILNAMANAIETTVGTAPSMEIRTGAPPTNTTDADSGTLLGTISVPSDWLNAASGGAVTLLGTWSVAMSTAGKMGYYRLKGSGAVVDFQGYISEPVQRSKAYAVGDYAHNGGNIYVVATAGTSASSGGPSGTGAGITDGSVVWNFVKAGLDMSADNIAVNAGQTVQVTTFTNTVTMP